MNFLLYLTKVTGSMFMVDSTASTMEFGDHKCAQVHCPTASNISEYFELHTEAHAPAYLSQTNT